MSDQQKKSVTDHVGDGVGAIIEGAFYCLGRASPAVADAAEALAGTRVGKHVVFHAHKGFSKGWNKTLEKREERLNREGRKKFGEGVWNKAAGVVKKVGEVGEDLANCVQSDLREMRGEGGRRPIPEPS